MAELSVQELPHGRDRDDGGEADQRQPEEQKTPLQRASKGAPEQPRRYQIASANAMSAESQAASSSVHRFAGSPRASRARPSSSLSRSRSQRRSGSSCADTAREGLSRIHRCHRSPAAHGDVSVDPSANETTS